MQGYSTSGPSIVAKDVICGVERPTIKQDVLAGSFACAPCERSQWRTSKRVLHERLVGRVGAMYSQIRMLRAEALSIYTDRIVSSYT